MSNLPISEQWYRAAREWNGLNKAASLLEESRQTFLSQLTNNRVSMGTPVTRADVDAKASQEYKDYVANMVNARALANEKKIETEYLKMRHWESQSDSANERTMAKL